MDMHTRYNNVHTDMNNLQMDMQTQSESVHNRINHLRAHTTELTRWRAPLTNFATFLSDI